MSKVNQKEGVFNAVQAYCEENGIDFHEGMKFEPTKAQRGEIVEMVTAAMSAGEIDLSADAADKYDDFGKLKSYCNGLVSNWIRKDPRLNGGEVYQIKNPGSRAGSGDKVISELRKLAKTLTKGTEEHSAVQEEIDRRLEIIKSQKAKKVDINTDLIPEDLKHLVSSEG